MMQVLKWVAMFSLFGSGLAGCFIAGPAIGAMAVAVAALIYGLLFANGGGQASPKSQYDQLVEELD